MGQPTGIKTCDVVVRGIEGATLADGQQIVATIEGPRPIFSRLTKDYLQMGDGRFVAEFANGIATFQDLPCSSQMYYRDTPTVPVTYCFEAPPVEGVSRVVPMPPIPSVYLFDADGQEMSLERLLELNNTQIPPPPPGIEYATTDDLETETSQRTAADLALSGQLNALPIPNGTLTLNLPSNRALTAQEARNAIFTFTGAGNPDVTLTTGRAVRVRHLTRANVIVTRGTQTFTLPVANRFYNIL